MSSAEGATGADRSVIISATWLKWLACCMIFFHHYLKSNGVISYYGYSPIVAIGIFCCLSGVFANSSANTTFGWLKKKFLRILIPAWLVGVPMLAMNVFVQAKPKGVGSVLMELFGLQFFTTPLFEATWFVTLILALYLAVFLSGAVHRGRNVALFAICLLMLYGMTTWGSLEYLLGGKVFFWIASFFVGYVLHTNIRRWLRRVDAFMEKKWAPAEGQSLPVLFDLTYYFYLVHPPVLYLLSKPVKMSLEGCFFWGIVFSFCASVAMERIDRLIHNLLVSDTK